MVSLMSEIVVKAPPPVVKLRPTQSRPQSAVHARPDGAFVNAARPSSASHLQQGAAGVAEPDVDVTMRAGGVPRPYGSVRPADASRFPLKGGFFERLTAQEAADRLDGVAGTTLPGAQALQEVREMQYMAQQYALEERREAAQAALQARREAAAVEKATRVPRSQQKFAWGAERISEQLLTKMDTFTARHEDHTRKLLWTLGTDPAFTNPANRSVARVTPQNFPRVCDRFGIACDETQAQQIFKMHQLPAEGCSVQALTSRLIDSPADMANIVRDQARRMHGDAARPATAVRPRTPRRMDNPYKTSHLCSNAWAAHAAQQAAAGRIEAGAQTDA